MKLLRKKIAIYEFFVIMVIVIIFYQFYPYPKQNGKGILLNEITSFNGDILKTIVVNEKFIKKLINEIGIQHRIFISIIYSELKLNYNDFDRFDEIRARWGFDPSVGFAQMKISTAYWIENNYNNGKLIRKSKSREELIDKIINDSTNVIYSGFYIKLIQDKLFFKFHEKPSIKLIASYYGRGIDYYREDYIDSSYYNQIGITAQEFYDSDKLLDSFPR